MSSEWTSLTIGDLVRQGEATVQTGPFGSQLHSHDYVDSGTPVIPTEAIGRGKILDIAVPQVDSSKAMELSRHRLQLGDILFARRGAQATGLSAIVDRRHEGALCGTGALLLRVRSPRVDPSYLAVLLSSDTSYRWLRMHAVGAVMPNLNTDIIKSLPLELPGIDEQRGLARFLGAVDDRITLLRETNATLEAIAQALFKSWFVDFDPVRAKQQGLAPAGMDDAAADLFPDSFEESALGPVPMGWPCIDLGELTRRCGGRIQTGPFGSQLHAKDYVDAGIPVVMPKDIVNRRVSTDSIARIGAADVERLARHKLQAGDIVFSRRGDVERHAPITEREVGWLCGTGCLLVRPGAHWQSPGFLSLLLDAPRARTWLVQHAVGATMPNLNTGILSSVPVVLPPAALLAAFDSLVAVTEVQRSSNASMAETLAEIRDTLLPRLISGQLRLPNVESVAT